MSSKAKSGLSAVRQFPEAVVAPPNSYTVGDASFVSAVRDGRGHAEYHIAAVNNTSFTLKVLHSWRSTGVFTRDKLISSSVDPESGFHVAEVASPIVKRFLKVVVTPAAAPPGLGANFEFGWYFLPRGSGSPSTLAVSVGAVSPGSLLVNPADVAVAAGATVALPAPPSGTRRQVVQVTGGDATTLIRVRQAGGVAGRGRILQLYGSTLYGGADGAIVPLEVENVAGPAASVHVDFEV